MLDLTGEEQEITVTDSTVITKQTMGGGQEHLVEKPWRNQTENHLTVTIQTAKPRKNQRRSPRWPGAPDGAGQTEEITLDDIKEGDVVAITLDDDGNAATITVQSMDMGGGQEDLADRLPVWTAMIQ